MLSNQQVLNQLLNKSEDLEHAAKKAWKIYEEKRDALNEEASRGIPSDTSLDGAKNALIAFNQADSEWTNWRSDRFNLSAEEETARKLGGEWQIVDGLEIDPGPLYHGRWDGDRFFLRDESGKTDLANDNFAFAILQTKEGRKIDILIWKGALGIGFTEEENIRGSMNHSIELLNKGIPNRGDLTTFGEAREWLMREFGEETYAATVWVAKDRERFMALLSRASPAPVDEAA